MFKIFKLRYIFWDNIKKNVKIKKYRYLELQDFMHFLSNFFSYFGVINNMKHECKCVQQCKKRKGIINAFMQSWHSLFIFEKLTFNFLKLAFFLKTDNDWCCHELLVILTKELFQFQTEMITDMKMHCNWKGKVI